MPTATTTEDSGSKLVQNHPHDFTKKPDLNTGLLHLRQLTIHASNEIKKFLVIKSYGTSADYADEK